MFTRFDRAVAYDARKYEENYNGIIIPLLQSQSCLLVTQL